MSFTATSSAFVSEFPVLLEVPALPIELAHLPERTDVVRIELDDLRVVRLRVLGLAEVVAVPLGEVEAEADLLLRIRLLFEPLVRRRDDFVPAASRLRHLLEVFRGLAIVEVLPSALMSASSAWLLIVEMLFEDARDAAEQIRLVGGLAARVEAREIELDERLPAARVRVELLELDERFVVGVVDLDDLLPGERRLVGIFDALAPERRDLAVLLDLLRDVFQRGGALHLHVDDVGPLLFTAVDRFESVHRFEVGTDLEQLAPCVCRVERLTELLAVRLAELAENFFELFGSSIAAARSTI